jgi:hypothetical protein
MNRQFSSLSAKQQSKAEAAYHAMKPEDFDAAMATATIHHPHAIKLPKRLVTRLKAAAKLEGIDEYRTMVRTWIEERLRRESESAR